MRGSRGSSDRPRGIEAPPQNRIAQSAEVGDARNRRSFPSGGEPCRPPAPRQPLTSRRGAALLHSWPSRPAYPCSGDIPARWLTRRWSHSGTDLGLAFRRRSSITRLLVVLALLLLPV